jgi:hypothetical protein
MGKKLSLYPAPLGRVSIPELSSLLLKVVGSSRGVTLPKTLIAHLPVQVSQLDKVLEACSREFRVRRDSQMECKVRSNSYESLCLSSSPRVNEESFI